MYCFQHVQLTLCLLCGVDLAPHSGHKVLGKMQIFLRMWNRYDAALWGHGPLKDANVAQTTMLQCTWMSKHAILGVLI